MNWSSCFWLRSAGFPFELLDLLPVFSNDGTVAQYERRCGELAESEAAVVALAAEIAPDVLGKLQQKFKQGLPVQISQLPTVLRQDAVEASLKKRTTAIAELSDLLPQLKSRFEIEVIRVRSHLISFLSRDDCREALFLSNPEALQRVDTLVSAGTHNLDSRSRQRLRLAWNYVQRLCSKNDTASFFGPIAWGRFGGPNQNLLSLEIGQGDWLAERKVFFEHWVILRLIHVIGTDPALQGRLPLRLSPSCHVKSGVLHFPLGQSRQLDRLSILLLEGLTGAVAQPSSHDLACKLATAGYGEDDVRRRIQFLIKKKVIIEGCVVEPGAAQPMLRLTQAVESINQPLVTQKWLQVIAQLEGLRSDFEVASLEGRMSIMSAIETLLINAGIELSRAQGAMYVGRFSLYEDCRRNLKVELGGKLETQLKRQMAPLMKLYSWLVSAVAVQIHDHYEACWQKIKTPSLNQEVDFLTFLAAIRAEPEPVGIQTALKSGIRHCWQSVMGARSEQAEIALTDRDFAHLLELLGELEPRAEAFAVLGKHIHSPDFMIAANSVEAIARDDYRIVLGEVHPGVHTVSQPVAQPFCPYRDEIRAEVQQLLAPHTLVVADSPETYQRSHIDWLDVPALYQVELPQGGGHVDGDNRIPVGRCSLRLAGGVLHLHDPVTGLEQDLMSVMPTAMHRICFALAGEMIGNALTARLCFGNMVVKRQSWLLNGTLLPELSDPGESLASFLGWRRWAADLGLPRFVFVKNESEPKPIYVDFHNPIALDLLANLAKKKEPMRFSEMCPAPDELWLRDTRGRFCSEFRTSYVEVQ